MLVADKVLLLLVISLTVYEVTEYFSKIKKQIINSSRPSEAYMRW